MRFKVYAAETSVLNDKALFDGLYSCVSDFRRIKTDKMRFQKGKNLSLGVEFLLMCACKDFGVDYKKMEIVENEFKKPLFKDCPFYFNLSHSGERAMCIMSDSPAGCDVEKMRTANMEIAKRFFTQDERESVKSDDDFYRIWTQKESYIKCTGHGMSMPLNEFSVNAISKGGEFLLVAPEAIDGYRYAWCVKKTDEGEDYDDTIEWKHIELFR